MGRVGPYELIEELGSGGLGQVWRARDARQGREVALKVLHCQLSPEERVRFAREGEAMTRVRDPGLVAVHALDPAADPPWLAMELVPGETLAARLRRAGPFAPRDALRIALQVARTVARLHAAGVVHRDIKPANVMLRPDDTAVLLDLGLGLLLDRSQRLTTTGQILGTPGYLSPEQVGEAARVGPPTDVHGLGGLLFALLTGSPPFRGDTMMEALAAVVSRPAPAPSTLRPGIPARIDALVLRCLEREPGRRPDARALCGELGALLARAEAPIGPLPLSLAALALVLACGAAGWSLLGDESVAAPLATAVAPVATAHSPPPSLDAECRALFARQDHRGALEACDRALAANPRDAVALGWRSEVRLALADIDGSHADCQLALEIDPRCAPALVMKGTYAALSGDRAAALDSYGQAIDSDPTLPRPYLLRSSMLLEMGGDWDQAVRDAEAALQHSGDDMDLRAEAHVQLAALWMEKGDAARALAEADRAVEILPSSWRPYHGRGQVRLSVGDAIGALADAERSLELEKRFADPWRLRSRTRRALGDRAGAAEDAARAADLDPGRR